MMTLITSALGIMAWTYHIDGIVRVIANTAYVLALPGWVPMYVLGFSGIRDQPMGIVAANGIAWVLWIGLIWIALRVRTQLVLRSQESHEPSNPARRAFLSNTTLGIVGVGASATPGYATLIEPWDIKVRRYSIPIDDLPESLDGLRLVQLADTHLGPRIPASFVRQAVDLVLSESPDLVLLTGDHIHDGTNEIDLAARLTRLLVEHARIGVVGVLGNHDWWGDGDRMSRALRDQGVHMIDNDRIWLDAHTRTLQASKPSDESLAIVGFGDLTDDHIDLDRAFRDVSDSTPRLVLSHNPDSAELASLVWADSPRVDLMCSGHTHGGQVRIPLIGTPLVPSNFGSKYAGGLVDGPAFRVQISRGVGMSMLPVRVGVPPEISVLVLTRA
ncbi:MAG: metallophosphoesterase [Phycisphaerales bacterium]